MSAVPAWKRLGLKLKGASTDGSPVSTVSQTTTTSAPLAARPSYRQQQPSSNGGGQYGYDNGTPFNKRKQFSGSYSAPDNKRPRRDDSDFTPSKRVSFTQDTKKAAPKKPKKKKAPKPQAPKQPFDFTPVVEYLRTWHKARDSWKFNKNHQTLLIKHLYDSDAIPSSDIDTFYLYISDIKGASRQRLVDQAKQVIKKDMEDGINGFPEGTKAPEDKQKQYEEFLAELLNQKAEIKDGPASNGNGKRSFDEAEFVLRTIDKNVQQRLVKRMRAENIVDSLESSDSGESTDMSATVTTNASSSRVKVPVANGGTDNGKEGPKLKTKRRNKLRTAGSDSSSDSDSSSSDSDSDSSDSSSDEDGAAAGSAGSSSSSSSDSDSDEDMDTASGPPDDNDSSSSSSSSSGSESDSGAAVANDDDSGSDGDSESSDDEDA
ncbi:hypothetical protein N0V82_001696 [Gnomoniopsis sp. IMI 355080]|nr:hypothetical protein N0V82_001696 [Gnomoniopsis sp. IMI 355080]